MLRRLGNLLVLVAMAGLLARPAVAENADPAALVKSLDFRHGHIDLPDAGASLELTDRFAYLDPKDSQTLLTKVWGNPPGLSDHVLGMLVPSGVDLLSAEGWAVLIEYENSGHISDDDASSINYDELLDKMKRDAAAANPERTKNGYPAIELLGWASPPYYDPRAKALNWAKRLRFGDEKTETLNYFIRVLGRNGVLDLNVIDSMDHFTRVKDDVPALLAMVSFQKGSTYADFNPGSDKVAAYGIAGLIAGGVLAKVGFFKGLIALLIAFKKVIGVAVIGLFATVGGFLKRLFRRRPST